MMWKSNAQLRDKSFTRRHTQRHTQKHNPNKDKEDITWPNVLSSKSILDLTIPYASVSF